MDRALIDRMYGTSGPDAAPGYQPLAAILKEAHDQAAHGKGKERHANGLPWDQQPILRNSRICGPGGPAQQVLKKIEEALGMVARGDLAAARAEVLGAIVYSAALHKLLQELETKDF